MNTRKDSGSCRGYRDAYQLPFSKIRGRGNLNYRRLKFNDRSGSSGRSTARLTAEYVYVFKT